MAIVKRSNGRGIQLKKIPGLDPAKLGARKDRIIF
jgi:hypothetical protein